MPAKDDIKYFNFAAVAFELTDSCPIRCRSCLRECSPKKHSIMEFNQIRHVLENIGTKGSFREVGFSGGECFMFADFLIELCTYINRSFHLPIVVSTNAYWAKDLETTNEILIPMARNGLKNIMISIDDFHLEFIDISHIKNCAISAIHNNIGVTLQVVYSKNTRRIEALKKDLNLNLDDSRLSWVETPCDPIGRASVEIPYDEFLRNPFTERSFCSILKLLSVRLDGSIVPCCGSGAEAPGLVIGNIWQDTIDEIIDRANQSPVINLLTLDGGPLGLIERLKEHGIGKYAERRYTSPCDACFQIFSDQEVIAILDEILEQNWINYYAMRIGWQTKLIQHLRHVKDQMRIQ